MPWSSSSRAPLAISVCFRARPKSVNMTVFSVIDHEVGRLDVEVDDVRARGVFQRRHRLAHEPHRVLHVQDAPGQDPVLQRLALDVAHGEIGHALLLARGIERHDVGVAQAGDRARLLQESSPSHPGWLRFARCMILIAT